MLDPSKIREHGEENTNGGISYFQRECYKAGEKLIMINCNRSPYGTRYRMGCYRYKKYLQGCNKKFDKHNMYRGGGQRRIRICAKFAPARSNFFYCHNGDPAIQRTVEFHFVE